MPRGFPGDVTSGVRRRHEKPGEDRPVDGSDRLPATPKLKERRRGDIFRILNGTRQSVGVAVDTVTMFDEQRPEGVAVTVETPLPQRIVRALYSHTQKCREPPAVLHLRVMQYGALTIGLQDRPDSVRQAIFQRISRTVVPIGPKLEVAPSAAKPFRR